MEKIIMTISCFMISTSIFAGPNIEGIQVYQKNMHLSEERKLSLANDINRYYNADNMWDVLRQEFSLPHYEDNPLVQDQIEFFLNHPDFLMNSATRAAPYLYYILQQVRKRHLPAEFVLIPMIESAYNPFAYSSAGAAGIWQLMPNTASGYSIKQNWWYDGRRDVVASTKAALDHLSYLGSFFEGNWLLAIAAYNTGEGNVLSAIRRNYRDGRNTSFWNLPVAQQTKDYVPRLLALAVILSRPDEYPITFPPVKNAPYLAQIDVGSPMDLKQAAYLAGLSLKKLMQFNPGYNRPTTDPSGSFKLVLPIENVQQFTENLSHSALYQNLDAIRYKVKDGDTYASVAKRYNTTVFELRKTNPTLTASLKPGDNLIVPNAPTEDLNSFTGTPQTPFVSSPPVLATRKKMLPKPLDLESPQVASQSSYTMQPGDTLYMVRNGDTLQKIAEHYNISPSTLKAINRLASAQVQPGNNIIIPTHTDAYSTRKYQLEPGDTIYMVRKGEDIEQIAQKFRMNPANIRIANLLASNNVQEGDRLVIPTHG